MIKKIKLNNYQGHTDSEFDLSKGVNVIIGKSDSGKSSVIRSLNLLFNNKPSGTSYITKGAKKTEIEIHFYDSEFIIKRIRSKNINSYYCGDEELKAMGVGVPDMIKDVINIGDLNFQFQMDSTFLLSKSPPEVSRYLNKIINLDVIDSSLSAIESKKRDLASKIKWVDEAVSDLEDEINELPDVSDVGPKLDAIDKAIKKFSSEKKIYSELDRVITLLDKVEKELSNFPDIENIEKRMIELEDDIEAFDCYKKEFDDIKSLKVDIKKLSKQHDKIIEEVALCENKYHKLMPEGTECPLCGQILVSPA